MAYYALHKLRIRPSELISFPVREKAFIYAAIDLKLEAERKEAARMKKK